MFQKARTTFLESTSLLMTVLRWRKPLLAVTLISALAAEFFRSLLYYTQSISRPLSFPSGNEFDQ